ncbi:hypothetical protein llap_38 [Limosa lapponica baueri]|uniref:Protein lin-7 homolog n=1 Tax=Limosa lapponica baueri TaxID=1758121 RepID=A0A2I0UUD1_LIMLA|nr:hypothetical protein llap_38 [Limosa lapponica baueri]
MCNSCITGFVSEKRSEAEDLDAHGVPEKLESDRTWVQLKHIETYRPKQFCEQPEKMSLPKTVWEYVARAIELLEKLQESGEVPVHKLQSLKKVLQSEFCTAIREVYQYMHETITVNGCPEFRARATAKATVAAFAASEGHSHPRVVELPKTDEGLGFNVMGGKEQNSPIYISRIIPGGVAERHGGLKRGDQLLSVNGVSVEGEHHEKAVELLKAAKDSVKLVVRYTPKVLEEMEARFEKLRTARRRQQQQLLIQQQQQQQNTQQNHMS